LTDLEAVCGDNSYISWHPVSKFNVDDVSDYKLFSHDFQLMSLADNPCVLRYHALERLHDLGALRLLVVREDSGHNHHCRQDYAEVQLPTTEQTNVPLASQ